MAKLRGKDRKLFEEFLIKEACQSDDLGVANAKLDGVWPGWEWMKVAVPKMFATTPRPTCDLCGEPATHQLRRIHTELMWTVCKNCDTAIRRLNHGPYLAQKLPNDPSSPTATN